jgi:hypothetical protein
MLLLEHIVGGASSAAWNLLRLLALVGNNLNAYSLSLPAIASLVR